MHSTNNMQLLNNFKNYRILIELERNAIISIIQCILRFVNPRFVHKTRFVNAFFGNEKLTNQVRGGFQKGRVQSKGAPQK